MLSYLLQLALSLLVVQVVLADDKEAAEVKKMTLGRLCSSGTCAADTCATETYEQRCVPVPSRSTYRIASCNSSGWSVSYFNDDHCSSAGISRQLFSWESMSSTSLDCTTLKRTVIVFTPSFGSSINVYVCPLTDDNVDYCQHKTKCSFFTIQKTTTEDCTKSNKGDLYYTSTFNDGTTMSLDVYWTQEHCNSKAHKMISIENQAIPAQGAEKCSTFTETVKPIKCPGVKLTRTNTKTRSIIPETTTETTTTTEATSETASTTAETTTAETTAGTPITEPSSINGTGDNDTDDNITGGCAGVAPICATCLLALFVVLGLMN